MLFIGCEGGFGRDPAPPPVESFKTGTGSLDMSFMRNAPPAEVFQKSSNDIILRLQNKGATDIRTGTLRLSYDRGVIELRDANSRSFDVKGKSAIYPQGESILVTFPFTALTLSTESQVRETSIVATACFEYETEVLQNVCIDTDPYDLRPEARADVCQIRDYSPGGTGGPIRVDKIETRFSQDGTEIQPVFTLTISQAGGRSQQILAPGNAFAYCSSAQFDTSKINIVKIYAELSDIQLTCDRDEINLYQQTARITCAGLPVSTTSGSFEAPLYIRLNYGVSEVTSHRMRIVR